MADAATDGDTVHFAPVRFQISASAEVPRAVGRVAVGAPLNTTVEVAGPEPVRMDEIFREALAVRGNPLEVVTDPHAAYFGAELGVLILLPGDDAALGEVRYRDWPGRDAPAK